MGNPKPTKAKPCKIGRKHTGQLGIRAEARKEKGRRIIKKKKDALHRRRKNLIAAYWNGEISEWPITN